MKLYEKIIFLKFLFENGLHDVEEFGAFVVDAWTTDCSSRVNRWIWTDPSAHVAPSGPCICNLFFSSRRPAFDMWPPFSFQLESISIPVVRLPVFLLLLLFDSLSLLCICQSLVFIWIKSRHQNIQQYPAFKPNISYLQQVLLSYRFKISQRRWSTMQ